MGLSYISTSATSKQGAGGIPHIDYDVENIVNAMVALPAGREYIIYKFITELKADLGIVEMTEMFDCFYMLAGTTERDTYINWAQPGTYDITLVGVTSSNSTANTLFFNRNIGWSGANITNGTSTLNTNFNPYNILCNFTNKSEIWSVGNTNSLNNTGGSYGLFYTMRNKALPTNDYEFGASTSGGKGTLFGALNTGVSPVYSLLSTNTTVAQTSVGNPMANNHPSLYSVIKTGYRGNEFYQNGDLKIANQIALTDVAVDMGPICLCNPNIAASPLGGSSVNVSLGLGSTKEVSFCYIGSKDIKPDIIYRRLKEYFDAVNYNGTSVTQTI